MKRVLLLFSLAVFSHGATVFATVHQIIVRDFEYVPQLLTIQLGDTVVWTNVLGTHDVFEACGDPLFSAPILTAPWVYQFEFSSQNGTVAGTYPYFCSVHPDIMWGAITVIGAPIRYDIVVADFFFSPPNVTVLQGDTVRWTNFVGTHNVRHSAATPLFRSGDPAGPGWVYDFAFDLPAGVYPYLCEVHSEPPFNMIGTVTVNSAPDPLPAPTALVIRGDQTNIYLLWEPVPGAACYLVYRNNTFFDGPLPILVAATSATSLTDFGAVATRPRSHYNVTAIDANE